MRNGFSIIIILGVLLFLASEFFRWRSEQEMLLATPTQTATTTSTPEVYYLSTKIIGPVLIKRVEPVYPRKAFENNVEGFVILSFIIDKTGEVSHIEAINKVPSKLFQAAAFAVQKWKYKPATLNKKPISVYYNTSVKFSKPLSDN